MTNRVHGGRGTLIIDNRASGGELQEFKTFTCAHCNCVVVMHPKRTRSRGYCRKCHALVCDDRVCIEQCNPIQACLELVVADPNIPALARTPDGSLLFDRSLLEKGKVY